MPRRDDIHKILILGSGPIVIGQACEFDYSGTQAARALRDEGYEVVLVNSNPATIMTDPELADRDLPRAADRQRAGQDHRARAPRRAAAHRGRADRAEPGRASWPRRASCSESGTRLIGARLETIRVAEDRRLFRAAMQAEGLDVPRSVLAASVDEALAVAEQVGYPVVVRPSFTLGGEGGGLAYNVEELRAGRSRRGIDASPVGEVLVEEGDRRLEGVRAGGDARPRATASWWSAPSRTSTPWACTPATRSPWRRP